MKKEERTDLTTGLELLNLIRSYYETPQEFNQLLLKLATGGYYEMIHAGLEDHEAEQYISDLVFLNKVSDLAYC